MKKITGYDLSRSWFDFCFENPDKISPNHSAIFFFAIEHCNRLGWKEKFGFPTQMTIDAIGIKKPQTYIKYFKDLCDWGFFKLVQKSTNQYSANVISLSIGHTKNGKALDKAFIKHRVKQTQKHIESNSPIIKQVNKQTIKPFNQLREDFLRDQAWKEQFSMTKGISVEDLQILQAQWLNDIDLKGEQVDNYKKYFTNAFNKGIQIKSTGERKKEVNI